MKRVAFLGNGKADLVEAEDLAGEPAAHEVEGRTLVSLVSAGAERAVLEAAQGVVHPGYASVIAVERVGADVKELKAGDVVFIAGPHAERARCAASRAVVVPRGLPPERAALARFVAIGMSTLTTTTARPPEHVVVTGLGIVGLAAALAFQRCGHQVTGVEPDDHRRRLAVQSGLSRTEASLPRELAGRVALALECSGREDVAVEACGLLRQRGELVLVGVPWKKTGEASAHALLHAVFHRYAVVRSGWEWEVPVEAQAFRAGSIVENLRAAMRWMAEGSVRPTPGVTELSSPREAGAVYERLRTGLPSCLAPGFDWR